MRRWTLVSLAALVLSASADSHAESAGKQQTVPEPAVGAPTSPAFDAIGATPTTVAQPTSIQALGASLPSSVDQNGHLVAAVAGEAAPLWLLIGEHVTLHDWRAKRNVALRGASRLTVSFATSAGASGITNMAEGVRYVIGDTGDPRWHYTLEQCLVKALSSSLPNRHGGALPTDADAGTTSPVVTDTAVKKCHEEAKARDLANAWASAVSAAITEQQGSTGRLALGKAFGWISASKNFGARPRLAVVARIASVRFRQSRPRGRRGASDPCCT